MSAFGRARAWLRAVVRRQTMEREMHDEMSAHLEQAAERFVARGMSRRDALMAAQREFGPVGLLQEYARDARGGQWIENLRRDVKYAFRYYARTPLTTITIILTLALGIGFSSAVFSVLNGILTRPAPGVPNDPALVKIRGLTDVRPYARALSYPELVQYAGLTSKFESVVGWAASGVVVGTGDPALGVASARGNFVTPNYFAALGVRLAAGRSFDQTRFEQRFPPELTAVISHGLALERFGSVQAALSKQILVNETPVTVIGVAPQRFNGAVQSREARNLWMPLSSWQTIAKPRADVFTDPNATTFEALARLRPGVGVSEATSSVKLVAARADAESRALVKRTSTASADVVRLRGLIDVTGRYDNDLGPVGFMMSFVAILILLVCTATVSSLLVGSAVARRYEIGVRLALGASRGRVIRQLFSEIAVLALVGGALGLWAFGTISRLIEVAQDGFEVSPNWETIVFTTAYALIAATLCGLSPALHATRAGLAEVLKDSAASVTQKSRLQRTFVITQIAVAQPLMVLLAAVTANGFNKIPSSTSGTVRDRIVIAELDTYAGYNVRMPDRIPAVVQQIERLPGVVSAHAVGYGLGWMSFESPIAATVRTGDASQPAARAVTYDVPPGYFRTIDARIVRGREFVPADTVASNATPLILSESLAVALFRSRDPIGQRLRRLSANGRTDDRPNDMEVVGIVRMVRDTNSLEYPSDLPPVFVPYKREREGRLVIRTAGPAEPLIPAVVAVLRNEAPTIPVRKIQTLAEGDRVRRESRLGAFGVIAGCGVVVLMLASIGLYAMVSVAVGQRRREIGVRVALGARAREVVSLFLASGVRVAAIGLAIGLPLSIAGLAAIASQTDVEGMNVPGVVVLVAVAVVAVSGLASWLPARRAARVDPITVLRSE